MKKVYGRCVYDTEDAEVVRKCNYSYFGDPAGYEEVLYRTPAGNYFVYANGGAESPYPEERIQRLPKAKVDAWLAEH